MVEIGSIDVAADSGVAAAVDPRLRQGSIRHTQSFRDARIRRQQEAVRNAEPDPVNQAQLAAARQKLVCQTMSAFCLDLAAVICLPAVYGASAEAVNECSP